MHLPRTTPLPVAAALALGSPLAIAQFGTGRVEWQISTDEGATWQGGRVDVGAGTSSVRARMLASWTS